MNNQLSAFELSVHNCKQCKNEEFGHIIDYYPVLSFGDPMNKPLLVVGLNPSTREYTDEYLSKNKDPVIRHQSQLKYFDHSRVYIFFKHLSKMFEEKVQVKLKWIKSPWEKIGFVDIVKCPTRTDGGQWTSIRPMSYRRKIVKNCEGFLERQLELLKPIVVMAYGADVCRWFYPEYKEENNAFTTILVDKKGHTFTVILVPQARGSHPNRIIKKVQGEIVNALNFSPSPTHTSFSFS